ncbi:ABC transporter ATP-binding protein [Azoarcus sp. DN11]|uniref:ABC transporter ATP-binding protein n=1 Tax=Azoarcus sp. DN11 TaxID=356837 RepID=UPI000EB57EA0|nr:ABC transporter ATP-binding protein [Azoarcus sp. DN11]AYH41960.1 ABC transporter [Azoarcus sp. DN11]
MQGEISALPPPSVLAVAGLSRRFGDYQALVQADFEVYPGEILGIIGPNGAGKTTLMECLAGLQPADAGEVTFRGRRLAPGRRKEAMFYLPDGITPWAEQPVCRITGFFREMFGRSLADERLAIDRLALGPVLGKATSALSKGYRRRLLLALALLTPHPVLILDEPFDGFDLRQTLGVMALLREIAAEKRTLILSIHQLNDAERICDRLLLLDAGRVLGCGTLAELRQQADLSHGSLEEVFLALT